MASQPEQTAPQTTENKSVKPSVDNFDAYKAWVETLDEQGVAEEYQNLKAEYDEAAKFIQFIEKTGVTDITGIMDLDEQALQQEGLTDRKAISLYASLVTKGRFEKLQEAIDLLKPKVAETTSLENIDNLITDELIQQKRQELFASFRDKFPGDGEKQSAAFVDYLIEQNLKNDLRYAKIALVLESVLKGDSLGQTVRDNAEDGQTVDDVVEQVDFSDPEARQDVKDKFDEIRSKKVLFGKIPHKGMLLERRLKQPISKEVKKLEGEYVVPSKWVKLLDKFKLEDDQKTKDNIDNIVHEVSGEENRTMYLLAKVAEKMGLIKISEHAPKLSEKVSDDDISKLFDLERGDRNKVTKRLFGKVKFKKPMLVWLTVKEDLIKKSAFAAPENGVVASATNPDLDTEPTGTATTSTDTVDEGDQPEPEAKAEDLTLDQIIEFIKNEKPDLLSGDNDLDSINIAGAGNSLKVQLAKTSIQDPSRIDTVTKLSTDIAYIIKAIQEKPNEQKKALQNLQQVVFNLSNKE